MKYELKRQIEQIMSIIPDKFYLELKYYSKFKRKLNLKNPQSYNEKIQWLKLNDRNPLYTKLVDKYEVRNYVIEKIGKDYLIPILGVWDKFDSIDFSLLPNCFVLKCTHDSGGLIVCKDKTNLNIIDARKKLNRSLAYNYYFHGREWPYKNIRPKIIAEKLMEDNEDKDLKDYKFFCFNGVPKIMFIASDRNKLEEETKFDFFDMNFNHLQILNGHPNSSVELKKPACFDEMKNLASILSKGLPQIRVDFYYINKKIYFGELTLFHWSGFTRFKPDEWDYKLGEFIKFI